MAISNFLVYNYTDKNKTYKEFTSLGFNQASIHKTSGATFWHNKNCIVLLYPADTDGLGGVSFVTTPDIINSANAIYDDITGWFCFGNNFKIYLQTEAQIKTVIQNEYQASPINNIDTGIDKFGGVVLNLNKLCDINLLNVLELKETSNDKYLKFVSDNNFSIYFDKENSTDMPTVFVDCFDIFKNIALLSLDASVQMKTYPTTQEDFGRLTHKINGYNCIAEGNKDSYTIEKMILNVPSNVNFVLRQRSKKLHINETMLHRHYELDTQG